MNPADYFTGHNPRNIPTPVAVTINGKVKLRSLASILYGAPPPEGVRRLRRRMADLIVRLMSARGAITREELLTGFSEIEIDRHFDHALRLAGAHRLGETT